MFVEVLKEFSFLWHQARDEPHRRPSPVTARIVVACRSAGEAYDGAPGAQRRLRSQPALTRPSSVISNEPTTCAATATLAVPMRCCCNREVTSAENAENV